MDGCRLGLCCRFDLFFNRSRQKLSFDAHIYLFKDEEVEEDHAEVVNDEGFAELERLPVLHVFGPQPEEQQVGGADGQCGQGVVHQGPFLHSLVCTTDVLAALHNPS